MDHDRDQPQFEPRFDPYTSPPGQRPDDEEIETEPEDDELRGWLEKVDHKVGVRTYAGGLAIVLALAGAIVAVVLALGARYESATKNQLQSLKTEIGQASQAANKETQQKVAELSDKVNEITGSIDDLQGADSTNASSIDALRGDLEGLKGQISDLQASQDEASGGISPDAAKGLGDDIRNAIGGN